MEANDSQRRSSGQRQGRAASPAKVARGLGWFSIALGVAEIAMPRTVARLCGMQESERMVQACGVREIVVGIGILCARDPRPWLWGRVAGDVLDVGTLMSQADPRDEDAVRRNGVALANVAAITALDVYTARNWQVPSPHEASRYDYSDRSGMPQPPEDMRGAARKDFDAPRDMRIPELLRPWPVDENTTVQAG